MHPDKDLRAVLEYLCGEANKVFNCSIYYARQVWFKENRFVKKGELCGIINRTDILMRCMPPALNKYVTVLLNLSAVLESY
ncbi:MAG: CBS domain-containing protein [Okeania sp. SIO2H7]|nr:CBS domain-containing protein [Okeania sp. SIO2H7]